MEFLPNYNNTFITHNSKLKKSDKLPVNTCCFRRAI